MRFTSRIFSEIFPMKKLAWALCSLSLWTFSHTALAYEQPTHQEMSEQAALASVLNKVESLAGLGLKGKIDDDGIDDENLNLPNSKGDARNIIQLFRDGADLEDNTDTIKRPLNHFFDPTRNMPLTVLGITLGRTSPDWALEDNDNITEQAFSYRDAREYLFKALTLPTEVERKKNFGLTFQTLGQVIHHIQDMAQPQHVRNDQHLDKPKEFLGVISNPFYSPSGYEKYTDKKRELGTLSYSGYALVYAGTDTATFATPRKFWTTTTGKGNGGKGLAEYTNQGFFSAGTNVGSGKYTSPIIDPNAGVDIDISVLCNEVKNKNPCLPEILALASNKITFFSNEVKDTLRGKTDVNHWATSSSIFDEDLKKINKPPVYALNRFNFDAAHEFLIPRAVAYSAGLIDYFFRGKINLVANPDSAGSYLIKNPGNEDINGTFALYYDDVDGTRHPVPGASWNLQIAKNGQSSPLIFYAPVAPAPKVGGEYMLVFNGNMGEETADNQFIGAVAGKIVRPSPSGFIFQPGTRLSDGIGGTRLIYQDDGQWALSKESGLAAGNTDWKGWYVNGKPTKILTWRGQVSRYVPPPTTDALRYFSREIYQDGKLFSVAPAPVLGAALTKDAFGNEWLIAICRTANGDTVYRRTNTANTAPDLYDPVQAPEGWQHIATFANPLKAIYENRAWLFNGAGTEAQTMRCERHDSVYASPSFCKDETLTRLKITINGASANIVNLGNTVITESTSSTTSSNCEERPTTYYAKNTGTTTGETVVAVDYRDNQEILAKIIVNASRSYEGSGEGAGSVGSEFQLRSVSNHKQSTKLNFNGMEIILSNSSGISGFFMSQAEGNSRSTSTSEESEILLLDLRDNMAIYRQSSVQGDSSSVTNEDAKEFWSSTTASDSKYQLRHGATTQTFYSYPHNLTHSSGNFYPHDDGTIGCLVGENSSNYPGGYSDATTVTSSRNLSISSKDINAATDREGNLFVSMKYLDENKAERQFNFLSGGDPVAVTGIGGSNPLFYTIAPK